MNNITAAILAGGRGTRLRSAVGDLPKILAPVNGKPFISILLRQLADAGLKRVLFLTGFGADQVEQVLGDRFAGMTLAYSREPSPLGTGGALRHALRHVHSQTILLLNGDSYCAIDLADLVDQHRCREADMTLSLSRVKNCSRFGQVQTDATGRVSGFLEKQNLAKPGWINAGIYVIEKKLVDTIQATPPISLEIDLLPTWIRTASIFGYRGSERFLDIGTPDSYAEASALFS